MTKTYYNSKQLIRAMACALVLFFPSISYAEFCWMVGCTNAVGYVPLEGAKDGKKQAIFSGKPPKVGSIATLSEYVYLRVDPIDKPEGPLLLSPGTTVKVLEYLKTSQPFAVVRVVDVKNTRQDECSSKLKCSATIY